MAQSTIALDAIDTRILRLLQKDGRMPVTALAEAVGLTPTPMLQRMRKLEQMGVIQRFTAVIDATGIMGQVVDVLPNTATVMLITDPADYDACNAEYVKHFPGGLPARHTARFGVPTEAKVAFACIALAGDVA